MSAGLSSFDELEKEIEKVKTDFYTDAGGKNTFFKKQQKFDCAKQVVDKISIDILLKNTCYILGNTHCVHIDYTVLKSYASPEIFDTISDYIILNFQYVKDHHSSLEVFFNLDTFTISSAERYKGLIEAFCAKCFQRNTGFSTFVNKFVVYNSPTAIETIRHMVMPFMEENVKSRTFVIPKKESSEYVRLISTYPAFYITL
jgi:hypothetical protein